MIQPIIMHDRYHLVLNLFNAEKLLSEMAQEGNLNCSKCIHFLITPMKEIHGYERF